MTTRHSAILIGTHLLALGAGWWAVRGRDSEPAPDVPSALAGKTDRPPRQERRVDTADLIAAYGNSDFWGETLKLRSAATREEPATSGQTSVFIPAEQRAAEIADIPTALQKELESVNAGKSYDHELAKALIRRWMKEDAAACAAWLGSMNSRIGWGDPFNAFAESLPPLELIGLMDGWLRTNRSRALSAIAQQVAKENASELPAVLARLGGDEARGFLENAANYARLEDAEVWLSLVADDPNRLAGLAGKWIQGPGSSWEWRDGEWQPSSPDMKDWEAKVEVALAAAAGTPAEEIFRKQWELERLRSDSGRELARVAREPAEASAALVELYRAAGHDEAEAVRRAGEEISRSYQDGLQVWQREAWEQDLQLSLLGRQSLETVLAARLDAIDSSLPGVLRPGTRGSSWRDAMRIDPAATLEVARQRGAGDEAVRVAAELIRDNETPLSVQAEVLGLLAKQGLWTQGGPLPNAGTFAAEYLRDDPVPARAWLQKLPESFSTSIKEGSR
jgi:hypothetical protein